MSTPKPESHKSGRPGKCAGTAAIAAALWLYTGVAAAELADPMRPASFAGRSAAVPAGGLRLESTLVSPQRKLAIISGRMYAVGDSLDGAVIADIETYAVVMKRGDRVTELRLLPKIDTTTPSAKGPVK